MYITLIKHSKTTAVYNQQIKRLEKSPKDKQDVLASEAKLHALVHISYLKDLSPETQKMLKENPIQNHT